MGLPVLADTYSYYLPVEIFNNSTNVYGETPVLVMINNTQLAAWGYINSTGLNTNVQEGAADSVFMVATPRLGIYADSFAMGQVRTYYYRLNNLPGQTGFPIMVGVGGYMTVADSPSLELYNNSTVSLDGYIDTTYAINKNPVYKPGAYRTYVSAAGTVTGAILTPGTTWTCPTGFVDSGGTWITETQAYDNNTGTPADCTVPAAAWGNFLELTHSVIWTDAVRYWSSYDVAAVDQIDVDAYYNGAWNHVYQGIMPAFAWETRTFGNTYLVTAARVRYHNIDAVNPLIGSLYELQFREMADTNLVSVSAAGISSADHLVEVAMNTTWMSIKVDGTQRDQKWLGTNTTPNNGNTWYFMSGNSMPYMDYAKISITASGVNKGWWQPTYMVAPTNVVDRTGSGNTGTIIWGTNPTSLEVTVGGVVASEGGDMPGLGTNETILEIFELPVGLEIYENATATGSRLPLYDLFNRGGASLGWSAATTYAFVGMLVPSIVMTFAVGVATGNLIIGVLFGCLMLGMAAGTGIVAPWIPVTIVGVILMLLYVVKRT